MIATVCVPIVSAALSWALYKGAAYFHVQGVNASQAVMENKITAALGVGMHEVMPDLIAKGWDSPEVRADLLRVASNYFEDRFPDATTAVLSGAPTTGLTPADALIQTLSSRLPKVMAQAAPVAPVLGVASGFTELAATTLPGNPLPPATGSVSQAVGTAGVNLPL